MPALGAQCNQRTDWDLNLEDIGMGDLTNSQTNLLFLSPVFNVCCCSCKHTEFAIASARHTFLSMETPVNAFGICILIFQPSNRLQKFRLFKLLV